MKKAFLAVVLVLVLASSAFALFASGKVDDEVEYSNLRIEGRYITMLIHNNLDKRVTFAATAYFLTMFDDVLGESFIRVTLGPKQRVQVREIIILNTGAEIGKARKIEWERYR